MSKKKISNSLTGGGTGVLTSSNHIELNGQTYAPSRTKFIFQRLKATKMARKPKQEKVKIHVMVNGTPISVTLTPPSGKRKTWYMYRTGLKFSQSTGQSNLTEAIRAATAILNNDGKKPTLADAVMTDFEFEQIQRTYFDSKTTIDNKRAVKKSLKSALESIAAFKQISGLSNIAAATPDDCAKFQNKAIQLHKNWRHLQQEEIITDRCDCPDC